MRKGYFIYAIIVLLLVIAGIYGYSKWTEAKEKVNLWTLVPEDAVFVVESRNHGSLLDKLKKSDFWDNVSALRSVEALSENIILLDSLSGRNNGAQRFLREKSVLSSVHVISKTDFDFVFYVPVNTVGEHRFIRTLTENIGKSPVFKEISEVYQDHQIIQIRNLRSKDNFYYLAFHNNLIISQNKNLIKEIILKINRGQLESPAQEYKSINYLIEPEVFAQVFINYRQLPAFLNIFLDDEIGPDITYLASLCKSSMLGLKQQQGKLFLNGFSNPEPLSGSFYQQLKNQKPHYFDLRDYLPNRTALFLHVGLEKVASLKHFYLKDKTLTWNTAQLVTADSLVRTLQGEVGIAYLETNDDKRNSEKVIFVRSHNPAQTANILNKLQTKPTSTSGKLTGAERYNGFNINDISIPEFPALIFGSLGLGFEKCFMAQVDNYFVFGPDAQTLKDIINDIQAGAVWGKSENQKIFLEKTQQEANFSFYLNTNLTWNMLNNHIRVSQRNSLMRHESLVRKITQTAFQFSLKDNQYYTSLLINHLSQETTAVSLESAFEIQEKINFKANLLSAPFVVPIAAKSSPILVQDASLAIHNLAQGRTTITWSDSLPEAIVSEIHLVNFNSGNLNYVFATAHQIHCLDQNGKPVQNFPFILPDSIKIDHLTVFKSGPLKELRLLVAAANGNIFMYDINGNAIPGWQPKVMESKLAGPLQHFEVNGKEVLLAIQSNGVIYSFSPRGEVYPGFPLQLDVSLGPGIFTNLSSSFRNSAITVVTNSGTVVNFNLSGQITNKAILPKRVRQTTFTLIPEPNKKSYILVRQEPGKVSLFDHNLKLLLEKNFITSSPKLVQYFDFGPLNKIYALTETGPRKTYLHNYKAQFIGKQPLDNNLPVSIYFNPETKVYTLHLINGKELQKLAFRDN